MFDSESEWFAHMREISEFSRVDFLKALISFEEKQEFLTQPYSSILNPPSVYKNYLQECFEHRDVLAPITVADYTGLYLGVWSNLLLKSYNRLKDPSQYIDYYITPKTIDVLNVPSVKVGRLGIIQVCSGSLASGEFCSWYKEVIELLEAIGVRFHMEDKYQKRGRIQIPGLKDPLIWPDYSGWVPVAWSPFHMHGRMC